MREEQLRTKQMQLQCAVIEKQRIIQTQQEKIESLDAANLRLLNALGQLKERYDAGAPPNTAGTPKNGAQTISLVEVTGVADTGVIKSSYC